MQALTKPCQQCHKPMNGGVYRAAHICPHCLFEHPGGKKSRRSMHLHAVAKQTDFAQKPAADAIVKPTIDSIAKPASGSIVKPANDHVVKANGYLVTEETLEARVEAEAAIPATQTHTIATTVTEIIEAAVTESKAASETEASTLIGAVETEAEAEAIVEATLKAEPPVSTQLNVKAAPAPLVAAKSATRQAITATGDSVTLTTKPASEFEILAVLEEASAECVLSIELTPDLFVDGKFIGAKSEKVVAALKQGKKNALSELRAKAEDLGANMVTDIVIKNGLKMVDASTANITVSATGQAVAAETTEDALEI